MKPTRPTLIHAATASALALLTSASSVHAASGSWNVDLAGTWSNTTNWSPAAVPGTDAGDVVNLQFNIAAARTVTIDTTSRTVGDLNIGDPGVTLFGYTLAASGGASLILDGLAAADATVDFTAAVANAISAPITLGDNAVFRSNVANAQTLSGVISGPGKSLTFNNDTDGVANPSTSLQGQFVVSQTNTYSGGTFISDARVLVSNASGLGTGDVTITSGGQVYASAAITIPNNFILSGDGWLETTAGNPFGALRLDGSTVSGNITLASDSAVGTQSGTGTISGVISGDFALTKRGAGATVLSGANTHTGGTTVNFGVLQLNHDTAAGTGAISLAAGTSTATATRLAVNGGVTIANSVSIPATGGVAGRGVLEQVGTGLGTLSGPISITGTPAGGGHFYGGSSAANALVLAGPITSSVGIAQRDRFVVYSGGGTGYTTMQLTGTALVGAENGLATTCTPNIGASAAGTLNLNGFNQTLPGINKGANAATVTNTSTVSDSVLTLTGTSSFAGVIANGTRKLSLAVPSGELTLSGVNTFSGDVEISGGTVVAGLVTTGLTGHLGASTAPATASKYINFTNGGTLRNTTTFNNNAGSASNRQFIFNFGTGGGVLDIPDGASLTLDDGAVVSSAQNAAQLQGAGNLTKIGAGTLSLGNGTSDFSAYTGQILVSEGTLTTGAASANPFGDLLAGTSVAAGATLDVKGVSIGAEPLTINGLGVGGNGALISSTGTVGTATGPVTFAADSSFGGAGRLTLSGAVTSSGSLTKVGAGEAVLSGNLSALTGPVTVAAGILRVPGPSPLASVTVSPGAGITGEGSITNLTLNGGTVTFDPATPGALTVANLTAEGANLLEVTSLPANGVPLSALAYTSKSGAGTFAVANAASYRSAPVVTDTGSQITVTFGATKDITWTGAATAVWTTGGAEANWVDGVPAAETFFAGDSVTFPSGGANPIITLSGLVMPTALTVASDGPNYSFTATAGNQISGLTGLTKSGASTLSLVGANAYSGPNVFSGGIVSINGTNCIGNAGLGNTISLSGGAKLRYTGTAALNYGEARHLTVGTGGGSLAFSSGTAATTTVSGDISGSGSLGFVSEGATTGTYSLTGNNSGYTGDITISSSGAGVTNLSIASQASIPASGSITINNPQGSAANTLNVLTLNGVTIPETVTIFTNAGLNTVPVLTRSNIITSGNVTLNGPVKAACDATGAIIQLTPGAGSTMTVNGNISETSVGGFNGSTFFLRGTGNITLNGTINLPVGNVFRTDLGVLTVNSTGNVWANASLSVGTTVLGINDGLCTTAPLNLGQNDANAASFNLSGFNQTVAGLTSNPTTVVANSANKTITSVNPATLTVSPAADVAYAGAITGAVSLVKEGAGIQRLLRPNTFTGSITVNSGILSAETAAGTGTVLGTADSARTLTVNTGGSLEFMAANILSANFSANAVPSLVVNGGTATNNVVGNNALGDVTLNGGTLTATGGHATYGAFNLNGAITSSGTSTISASGGAVMMLTSQGANGVNTASQVNVSSGTLTVSAPLGDLSVPESKISGLNKLGAGNLVLAAANSYTGGTTVNGGTVLLGNAAALGTGAAAVNTGGVLDLGGQTVTNAVTVAAGGTLAGVGGVNAAANTVSGTVSPGGSPGTISFSNTALTFAATSILNLEIGGTTGGTFDVVGANGAITLASGCVVNVTLINGFVPVAGNSFDLIADVGGVTSAATLNLPVLSGGLAWDTSAFGTTGTITVVSGDPVVSYAQGFGLTGGNTAADADPDKDGIPNALEYAFGINPTQNNGPEYRGVAAITAGNLTLTYRRPSALPSGLTSASYVVQVNTVGLAGAGNWVNATAGVDYTQTVTPLGGGVDSVAINFTGAVSGRKFGRISVNY